MLGLTAGLVAAILATAVAINVVQPPSALAGVEPALTVSPVNFTKDQAISRLTTNAREHAADAPTARFTVLTLNETALPEGAKIDDSAKSFGPINELKTTFTPAERGAYSTTTQHKGIISARSGERIASEGPDGHKIPVGTTTNSEVTPPIAPLTASVPTAPTDIAKYATSQASSNTAAFIGDKSSVLFEVLGYAMSAWNPTYQQSASILTLLEDNPSVTLDGRVTDRLGHTGLMFSVVGTYQPGSQSPTTYSYKYSFIFDEDTGHLNAYEQTAGQGVDYFVPNGTLRSATVEPTR